MLGFQVFPYLLTTVNLLLPVSAYYTLDRFTTVEQEDYDLWANGIEVYSHDGTSQEGGTVVFPDDTKDLNIYVNVRQTYGGPRVWMHCPTFHFSDKDETKKYFFEIRPESKTPIKVVDPATICLYNSKSVGSVLVETEDGNGHKFKNCCTNAVVWGSSFEPPERILPGTNTLDKTNAPDPNYAEPVFGSQEIDDPFEYKRHRRNTK